MNDMVWFCSNCQKFKKLDIELETRIQLSGRSIDDTRCTVIVEPESSLGKINILQRNPEFTMKRNKQKWCFGIFRHKHR